MIEVEFNYYERKTMIKANINDSFGTIINKYLNQSNLDIKNICFI